MQDDYKYTQTLKFNSNKSGDLDFIQEENGGILYNSKVDFTWSTDVDVLTIIFDDDEMGTVDIYYSIEGNKLSISDGDDESETVFTKI